MSVYREKRVWRYEIQVNGKRYTGWGFKTKREARQAAEQRRRQLRLPKSGNPTLRNFASFFLKATSEYKTEAWTAEQRRILNRIFSHLYDRSLLTLTAAQLEQAIAAHADRVGPVTLNKYRNVISAVMRFAVERGYLDYNPVKALRRRPQPAPQPLVPTADELERLLNAAEGDLRDILICQLYTLGRLRDILELKCDDVDFNRRVLVMRTRKRRGGHEHTRVIPITEPLLPILKHRRLRAGGSPYLFPRRNRRSWYEDLEKACGRAGIRRLGFHSIRHHQARLLASAGVDLPAIQAMLGHGSLTVTARYVQALTHSVKAAAHVLAEKTTRANHTCSQTSETG